MGTKDIDIRVVELSKWHVPKQKGIFKAGEVTRGNEKSSEYLGIGHFDTINVKKVNTNFKGKHPLLCAYDNSFRRKQSSDDTYAAQELMVFTDITDIFTRGYVERFWDMDDLLFFISFIHVDNEDNIREITNRIKTLFQGNEYIYYFSFDYSGIIIFAKDMPLSEYLKSVFQLNYDNNNQKIIRDSYSAFGLSKNKLKKYFDCENNSQKHLEQLLIQEYAGLCEEKFSVSVNVGISEYEPYRKFIGKLKSSHISYQLFGRYDVAIVNNEADLPWIIYMQYLLNCAKGEPFFSTYETFVKIPMVCNAGYRDGKNNASSFLLAACRKLERLKEQFIQALQEQPSYDGQYELPLCAVISSIKSISGNGFAEDFVLCMYQSFYNFILYLTEKLSHKGEKLEAQFDQCYSEYFKGLNSLVNSAMHSERQFIQATAFNAIIYDVPPKIMAFYVAMISDLQKIVHTRTDKTYTFFLAPSFANQISVKIFSYEAEELPHDRLIMVTLNEESLFNPKSVIREMAHEIAHFEGDSLRRRSDRKKSIKQVLVYFALSKILFTSFLRTPEFMKLGEDIRDLLNDNMILNDKKFNYSDELMNLGEEIYLEFYSNMQIQNLLKEYVKSFLAETQDDEALFSYLKEVEQRYVCGDAFGDLHEMAEDGESGLDILTNLVMMDVRTAIEYLNTEEEIAIMRGETDDSVVTKLNAPWGILGEASKVLSSIYSEVFADMHMVLLTGVSYSEYLNGFVEDVKIDITNFRTRQEDHVRMSAVSLIMYIAGIWEDVLNTELQMPPGASELHRMLWEKNCIMCDTINEWVQESEEIFEKIKRVRELAAVFCRKADGAAQNRAEVSLEQILNKAEREIPYDFENFTGLNEKIFFYLLECITDALQHYSSRQEAILEVRKTMDVVFRFENVEDVFSAICSEINRYKEHIARNDLKR